MKKVFLLILVLLTSSVLAQTSNFATATRAKNGKLVSLTNIVGLSDCETRNFAGEVRNIKVEGNMLHFELWEPEKDLSAMDKIEQTIKGRKKIKAKQRIDLDLNRIAPSDRSVLFRDMVRKSFTLRVAGYACNSGDTLSAFSIDLVY